MSIYYYPNYLDFIKNERKTLRFLADQPFINKEFNALAKSADIIYYSLPAIDKHLRQSEFEFGCNFDILIEKNSRRIAIEAKLKPKFSMATYVLSICELNKAPYSLIRKFHFDYSIPNSGEIIKPVYHIQYGGEQSPQLDMLKIDVTTLQPWLSTPRIRFYPINLALLLDMVFCEFQSAETISITRRSEWRDFIKNNEDTILKPFHQEISRFLNNEHKSNFLLRDFYYGMQN